MVLALTFGNFQLPIALLSGLSEFESLPPIPRLWYNIGNSQYPLR